MHCDGRGRVRGKLATQVSGLVVFLAQERAKGPNFDARFSREKHFGVDLGISCTASVISGEVQHAKSVRTNWTMHSDPRRPPPRPPQVAH